MCRKLSLYHAACQKSCQDSTVYISRCVFLNCIYMQIHMHVHHRVPLIFLVGMEEGYRVKVYTVVLVLCCSIFCLVVSLTYLPTVVSSNIANSRIAYYVHCVVPSCFA